MRIIACLLFALVGLNCDPVNTLTYPAPLSTYKTPGSTVALAVLNRNALDFDQYFIAVDLVGLAAEPQTAGGMDLDGDGNIDLQYTSQPQNRAETEVVYMQIEVNVDGLNFPNSVAEMVLVADERFATLDRAGGTGGFDFVLDNGQLVGLWSASSEEEVLLDTPLDIPVSRTFANLDSFEQSYPR